MIPSLHVRYKTTKIKQYFKENRALLTETTINDTDDFAIGRRLQHLPARRDIGFSANRRLLDVQTLRGCEKIDLGIERRQGAPDR